MIDHRHFYLFSFLVAFLVRIWTKVYEEVVVEIVEYYAGVISVVKVSIF